MKISIITATYNAADTLADTMESVLRQTHTNLEYIVIDGQSKDATGEIVARYAPRFGKRLVYVCEPDKGIYDAMNKGLKLATGDVVGILNADDFFTSDHVLEKVAAEMAADPDLQAIYGDVHYVNSNNLQHCVRYYSSQAFRPAWMKLGFMPAHPSFYCRRSVYGSIGVFDTSYRVAADFELLLRLIYINKIRTKYVPLDFVTMRTGGISNAGLSSHKRIMRDHHRALRNNNVHSSYFLLSLRYFYKAYEVMRSKWHYRKA